MACVREHALLLSCYVICGSRENTCCLLHAVCVSVISPNIFGGSGSKDRCQSSQTDPELLVSLIPLGKTCLSSKFKSSTSGPHNFTSGACHFVTTLSSCPRALTVNQNKTCVVPTA